ncbi:MULTISPECIES: hypothetical protein [unclassified Streptomyces]|uniref:hypothetical protein n=1 Tax=unclassified Streptomyces TaxID=2593676 RepID=UPI002E15AE67|nr:hypothetical protein OG457_42720 [Streptomyces sp. NBC_01207]WTA23066.1 hypothetical protein OG365_36390 [Streptomyces sp. NBC_00853]
MSDSVPPSEPAETAAVNAPATAPVTAPETEARKSAAPGRLVPRGKRARWVAAGAVAVVVVGGVAVAAAGHHDRHMRVERGPHMAWAGPGPEGGLRGGPHAAEPRHEREQGEPGRPAGPKAPGEQGRPGGADGRAGSARNAPAPAPIPSLAIGEAAEKAAAAVPGGKVAGLRAVAQEGGGSAWLAVVIGSDGVRHAVTVSGTDGTITSNTTKGH